MLGVRIVLVGFGGGVFGFVGEWFVDCVGMV